MMIMPSLAPPHMRSNCVPLLGLILLLGLSHLAEALWPQPKEYTQGATVLWLADDVGLSLRSSIFSVEELLERWGSVQNVINSPGNDSTRASLEETLQSGFDRIKSSIFTDGYVPEKFHPYEAVFEPGFEDPRVYLNEISMEIHETAEGTTLGGGPSDEAYTINISESGTALIEILSVKGGLHALETLRQLFFSHTLDYRLVYLPNAPISIKDSPLFEHRGLNLDISRNRIFPTDVLRTLEGMAANKLNRLHIHATDSQSWPIEIPTMPDLAKKGAYHKSQIWTENDLRVVQAQGQALGIEVFLEIDVPGHTGSVSLSYPDLVVAYKEDWTVYAAEPPAGQLKLALPGVFPFLTQVLSDLLPRVSPFTTHFHVGGDELNINAYSLEPGLETSEKAALRPYVQAFYNHVFSLLANHEMTAIAWEETVLEWDLQLPPSTIIQTWRAQNSLADVVSKGHRALFGPSSHWYLDCGFGTWVDPDSSKPLSEVKPPFSDWCPPYKNWRLVYSYDPLEGVPEQHRHLVIGGEVHLWSELTDSVTLDGMLWPRVAAAAEVMWRGKTELNEDATRRLAEVRERLVGRGIAAGMVQMEWCLKNPGHCST